HARATVPQWTDRHGGEKGAHRRARPPVRPRARRSLSLSPGLCACHEGGSRVGGVEAAGTEATYEPRGRERPRHHVPLASRASRIARAAIVGSDAPNSALITATPAAPADRTAGTRSLVIPPIATAGSPHRRASSANRSGPIAAPASALLPVANTGPIPT